jgi:glycine dehydrogenase subunit 2
LSKRNFSADCEFYPLGSCTMKHNPKAADAAAALEGFSRSHAGLRPERCQGALALIHSLQGMLSEIGGFATCSLQPAAGAQAELAGVLMMRAWQRDRGGEGRTRMLIPDSAHGTNPATCSMAGLETVTLASGPDGCLDMGALEAALDGRTCGLMITNPNTLGIFERRIVEICERVHAAGGLVYGDGANMNALAGILKPARAGIDVMHFNLHKTFSTPHGGGGPGAGALLAGSGLADYLPGPLATESAPGKFSWRRPERSIGRVKAFHGNFAVLARAYVYLKMLGAPGLRRMSECAVLSANYLRSLLAKTFPCAYERPCMHEFVVRADSVPGLRALDLAKRLIDYGFHPPTVYFPLIVKEALMIEPTETESRETMEAFAEAMIRIAREAAAGPDALADAPRSAPIGRLDEAEAARRPVLRYSPPGE